MSSRPARTVTAGEEVVLDASGSTDPDGNALTFDWFAYLEAGTYSGAPPLIKNATSARPSFRAPAVSTPQDLHLVLTLSDNGVPSLTRYQRVSITVKPEG